MNQKNQCPELLAPAGQIESFMAALENGADAVYLGLKQFSARAMATNFTLKELSHLIPYAHGRKISVYVALNNIITTSEIPEVLDILQSLSDLQVDGLIIQDAGIFYLAQKYFPTLRLHASTLMTIHNHAGVNQLQQMGAERVVLARELSLDEIEQISTKTRVSLEVFVHGALCFSYSGLCLASSFRGGRSGLQGRCVQPCRLRFRHARKEGFFLSCNDFCALPLIPRLKTMRIAAFKIEGRMKSADYIAQVVKAYRYVLDASPEESSKAITEAQEWLTETPTRRLTLGFLAEAPEREVLAPHRSGSSGSWVGTIKSVEGNKIKVLLRRDLLIGDRLRPESKKGKEEKAFTVTEILSETGNALGEGSSGGFVYLTGKGNFLPEERLFRVGRKEKSASMCWQEIRQSVPEPLPFTHAFQGKERIEGDWSLLVTNPRRASETLFLKINHFIDLSRALKSPAQRVLLTATKTNLERVAKKRLLPAQKKRFIWSLPPLIQEKDVDYYHAAVEWFMDRGFGLWEVNNWGHFHFFSNKDQVKLMGGYRLNLRNPAAMAAQSQMGCQWSVLSLEVTQEELKNLGRGPLPVIPFVCLYIWPPLFTSRLSMKLREDKPLITPRRDVYLVRQRQGWTHIYPDCPVNWLAQLPTLRSYGYRCFMIDLSEGPQDQMKHFERLLSGYKRNRTDEPYSLFNLHRGVSS